MNDVTNPHLSRYIPVPESGCWIWERCLNSQGYGILRDCKKQVVAHRYFYEQLRGPIPVGLTIDHLCRVRCCVNPDHMEVVTMRVNLLRGVGVVAINARKTQCPKGHSYSKDNTYISHSGHRHCRICKRMNDKRYRASNRLWLTNEQ